MDVSKTGDVGKQHPGVETRGIIYRNILVSSGYMSVPQHFSVPFRIRIIRLPDYNNNPCAQTRRSTNEKSGIK